MIVADGTNQVIGSSHDRIPQASLAVLGGRGKSGGTPELWDDRAAQRIVQAIPTTGKRE